MDGSKRGLVRSMCNVGFPRKRSVWRVGMMNIRCHEMGVCVCVCVFTYVWGILEKKVRLLRQQEAFLVFVNCKSDVLFSYK